MFGAVHRVPRTRYDSPGLIMSSVLRFNLLRPHDALKHHFTSRKTDLIFLQPRVLE